MGLQARAVLALVAYGVFLAMAIGVRMLLQRRWTGESGFKLHRLGSTEWERVVGVLMAIALAGIVIGVVGPLAGMTLGGPETVAAPLVAVAFAIAMVAVALTFWAQIAMGASWRIGLDRTESTDLVTQGPYRLVRNPIYTAMMLFFAALIVMLPNIALLVGIMTACVAIEIDVRKVEEPFLREHHGSEYGAWSRHAGRFVPGLGRL